ncbi:putative disease resistance protein RGA3 [Benincasa hispida]|uniref:putative disease resistance protein RGA3 n=1 Tax=Benincasa hispida TaxID=102211 RepID=UPI0019013953|nr:putative disease resistance protein RGA3 [Benincasa hispida]
MFPSYLSDAYPQNGLGLLGVGDVLSHSHPCRSTVISRAYNRNSIVSSQAILRVLTKKKYTNESVEDGGLEDLHIFFTRSHASVGDELVLCNIFDKKSTREKKQRLGRLHIQIAILSRKQKAKRMAEFLWIFAVQEVLKKTVKVAAEEISMAWGFKKELSKLRKCLLKSEAILRDINKKKLHHESVRMWVEDLQHFVYEVDDLLDELVYEHLRQKVDTEKRNKKVRNFFSSSNNPFPFRRKMAKRMKDITETLYKHYCEASPLGLVALLGEESIETHKNINLKQIRETTSNLNFEEVIIGREVEVSNIVKMVIESSNEHPMSIIPIVGMGGLGETTLAKMVFNHELVKDHFDETIWVCVSEPFIILNILEGMFQSLTKTSSGLNKENLLRKLQEEMQGKSYLLVLDYVWNEEARLWGELRECLKNIAGKFGNSIIVTTRSAEVATVMETTSSHHLTKLSDDQCWSLFKESASANGLSMSPKLEIIQKLVIRRIGGVPLVAKVLGGATKFEGNYERWLTQVESVVTNISNDDKDFVFSTLKLSVDCLPLFSLKQCFAYCSNFPKDYEFAKETLIQMWIAQGFIQAQKGNNTMLEENIGEDYINFLLSRSLFQDVSKDIDGTVTHFKMHDLIHDIACVISSHQNFEFKHSNWSEKSTRKLRTTVINNKMIHDKLVDLGSLRVLVMNSPFLRILPDSIGMLKHLRYLDIIGSSILKLPESITMLYNLQTLKLGTRVDLPKNLRKLVMLRHLQFFYIYIKQMPLCISQLIHLQTLPAFVVGSEKGCKIEELGPLNNLKGSLQLSSLNRVKSKKEAIAAKLMGKKNLCELTFEWDVYSEEEKHNNCNNDFEVLEGLQPHKNLRSLSVVHYGGQVLPNGIFVENLVIIFLQECNRCEMLPMLGQLPNLEELHISSMGSVRSIGSEFYGNTHYSNQRVSFPKLKELSFRLMQNLEQWEDVTDGIAFPYLQSLSIVICSKLLDVPHHFVSLRTLRIVGCEELAKLPNGLNCPNSIESLKISECPNLALNLHNMHNLKEMEIVGCMQDYDFSPLLHQSSILTHLSLIDSLRNATELPRQLKYLTALKALTIKNFNSLEALPDWLGNLTSLETLGLFDCKNLKCFPSKEVMLCLKKLNHLHVRGCPMLLLGQDDPEKAKLSHLPNNCVDVRFQSLFLIYSKFLFLKARLVIISFLFFVFLKLSLFSPHCL